MGPAPSLAGERARTNPTPFAPRRARCRGRPALHRHRRAPARSSAGAPGGRFAFPVLRPFLGPLFAFASGRCEAWPASSAWPCRPPPRRGSRPRPRSASPWLGSRARVSREPCSRVYFAVCAVLADGGREQVDPRGRPEPPAHARVHGGDHFRLPAALPGLGDVRAQPHQRRRHRGHRRAHRRRPAHRSLHRQAARASTSPSPRASASARSPGLLQTSPPPRSQHRLPPGPLEVPPGAGTAAPAAPRTSSSPSTSTGSAISAPRPAVITPTPTRTWRS